MGKNRYSKCVEMIEGLKKRFGSNVSFNILKREIMVQIGGDSERTIKPCINFMVELNLIKELKNGTIRLG